MALPPFAPENLGAAVAHGLAQMQIAAESRMRETCTIDRVLATGLDADDRVVVTSSQPIYTGILRVVGHRPYPEDRDVAGGTATSQMYDLHIPAVERMAALVQVGRVTLWAGPIRNGDRMVRTTPGRAPEVYRIETEHDTTDQTAQRLIGRLLTGGVWS